MTLVDCLDSVLMLYAYAAPDQESRLLRWSLLDDKRSESVDTEQTGEEETTSNVRNTPSSHIDSTPLGTLEQDDPDTKCDLLPIDPSTRSPGFSSAPDPLQPVRTLGPEGQVHSRGQQLLRNKGQMISSLSISLTLLSILVALRSVPNHTCYSRL